MLIPSINLFKEALSIYKANYKTFLKIISWFLGITVLLAVLNCVDRYTFFHYINKTFPIYLVLSAISFVIGLWTQIVLIRLIYAGLTKQAIDKKTLNQNAWRDTVPFLWVSILVGIITLGGLILLIIPGLIFSVWYFFSLYVFTIDGTRGYAALDSSKKLIKGKFWQVVWRLIVTNIFYGLLLIVIVGIPTLIIGYLTKFAEFSPGFTSGPWWFDALQSLAIVLTLPLNVAFWAILYKNLKENKMETSVVPPAL